MSIYKDGQKEYNKFLGLKYLHTLIDIFLFMIYIYDSDLVSLWVHKGYFVVQKCEIFVLMLSSINKKLVPT